MPMSTGTQPSRATDSDTSESRCESASWHVDSEDKVRAGPKSAQWDALGHDSYSPWKVLSKTVCEPFARGLPHVIIGWAAVGHREGLLSGYRPNIVCHTREELSISVQILLSLGVQ